MAAQRASRLVSARRREATKLIAGMDVMRAFDADSREDLSSWIVAQVLDIVVPELQHAGEALASLRAAWNEHMATCPQHAKVPSFEEIDAWRNAPSNTASAGQGGDCA